MAALTFISKVEVGAGGSSSINLTSIPSTYTDLVLITSLRTTFASNGGDTYISFNGSTANLSDRRIQSAGTAVNSYTDTTGNIGIDPASTSTANTFGNTQVYIPNYAGATYKSYSADSVSENNATVGYVFFAAGLWSSTSAINSITLTTYSGSFVQYSTAYLYGIKSS